MPDIFKATASRVQNSYWVIWLFIAVIAMIMCGLYYFFEDTYSSYIGIQQVQESFNMKIVSFPIGLYLLAITPQIGQVVFGYLVVTAKNKIGPVIAVTCFIFIDAAFDVWYRSNQRVLDDIATAIVTILVTIIVYTLFSEVFITLGGGLALELFPSFTAQIRRFKAAMTKKPIVHGKAKQKAQQNSFAHGRVPK